MLFKTAVSICSNYFRRPFSSALYITNDKAQFNFVALVPRINFEECRKHKSALIENIKVRKCDIDFYKVEEYWTFYESIADQKSTLEKTKSVIKEHLQCLSKTPQTSSDEVEKLKLHLKIVKLDLLNIKDYLYEIEETAALYYLSLPNDLNSLTPLDGEKIIHTFKDKPESITNSHMDIAKSKKWLQNLSHGLVYLKNEAALFELAVFDYSFDMLRKSSFVPTVNTSFTRSLIVEGCCTDYADPTKVFTIKDDSTTINRLHIVGGATLYSFMTYFARFIVQPSYFPVRFFTYGKQYRPISTDTTSLWNLRQDSVVELFLLTKYEENEIQTELKNVIDLAVKMYEALECHFKAVYLPATALKLYESLAVSFQMYSPNLQTYVEVGRISLCGDFLSKRLMVMYSENKTTKYPCLISATLFDIPKILACVIENNSVSNIGLLDNILKEYALV